MTHRASSAHRVDSTSDAGSEAIANASHTQSQNAHSSPELGAESPLGHLNNALQILLPWRQEFLQFGDDPAKLVELEEIGFAVARAYDRVVEAVALLAPIAKPTGGNVPVLQDNYVDADFALQTLHRRYHHSAELAEQCTDLQCPYHAVVGSSYYLTELGRGAVEVAKVDELLEAGPDVAGGDE